MKSNDCSEESDNAAEVALVMFPGTLNQDAFDGAPEVAGPQRRGSITLSQKCWPQSLDSLPGKQCRKNRLVKVIYPRKLWLWVFLQVPCLMYFNFLVLNSDVV